MSALSKNVIGRHTFSSAERDGKPLTPPRKALPLAHNERMLVLDRALGLHMEYISHIGCDANLTLANKIKRLNACKGQC